LSQFGGKRFREPCAESDFLGIAVRNGKRENGQLLITRKRSRDGGAVGGVR